MADLIEYQFTGYSQYHQICINHNQSSNFAARNWKQSRLAKILLWNQIRRTRRVQKGWSLQSLRP